MEVQQRQRGKVVYENTAEHNLPGGVMLQVWNVREGVGWEEAADSIPDRL